MPMYTDSEAIAAYLGVTFTSEQDQAAEQMAAAATAFIDRYTGRSWQATSPVAGELVPVLPARTEYPAASGVAYLQRTPAVAVSAVSVRTAYPNAAETALDPASYELIDPSHGVLTVAGVGWYADLWLAVDYTFADEAPPDIALAATTIGAGEMARVLSLAGHQSFISAHPELAGLQSIAVGQNDVNVQLADAPSASAASGAGSGWAAPGSVVATILNTYRRVVIA
jgi:hypothetical protein